MNTKTVKTPPSGARGDSGAREHFKLARPIVEDGVETTEIVLGEPRFSDMAAATRKHPDSPTQQTVHLVALLAGVSEVGVRKMLVSDIQSIKAWFDRLDAEALDEFEAPVPGEYQRTFELIVPVQTDKGPVSNLTLNAPDLDSVVAAEKFKNAHEQTAAIIATCAGVTLPVVMGLCRRDVIRLEAWVTPFLTGTA